MPVTIPLRAALLVVLLAAGALAGPAGPAGATAASSAAAQGMLAGKIVGLTGDQIFDLQIVPLTGPADPLFVQVTTTYPTGSFAAFPLSPGAYRVLVASNADKGVAGWYPGAASYAQGAGRLVVTAGKTTTVDWSLDVDTANISGEVYGAGDGALTFVSAYHLNPWGVPDSLPLAEDGVPSGSIYTLTGLPAGRYSIVLQNSASNYLDDYGTSVFEVTIAKGSTNYVDPVHIPKLAGGDADVDRLAGADRYATSVAIARDTFPAGTDSVFVASGENYPDALAAGPLAGAHGAALLLVKPGSIPSAVADVLVDWHPSTIYVIGGTGSVTSAVETSLTAYAASVIRISGADRYATARSVADYFVPNPHIIFLANGANFPDALGAGPAASFSGGVVLLVKGASRTLDSATASLIAAKHSVWYPVRLVGGVGGISTGIDTGIAGVVHDHPRFAGADRYQTALKISSRVFPASDVVYLATGADFPDALAGAAAAAYNRAPILLVRKDCIPDYVDGELSRLKPSRIVLLGGTGVLSNRLSTLPVCG